MAAPTVRSVGAASTPGTTSPHSVPTPTIVSGDVLITVIEYSTGAATNHITATGWTELAWRDQTAVVARTDLSVMGRIADGTEGASVAFSIAGTPNHASGRMISIQGHGCSVIGDVVVGTITGGAASGTSPQTDTVTGITVTADSLILMIGGTALDAASTAEFSAWANSNLVSITERMDNVTTTGNGGGYGMATGTCAGTTTGSSTWDRATNEAWNGVQLGIKPAAGETALVIANASHAHTAANVVLTEVHNLTVADAGHGHTADALALTQVHALAVQDALHGHAADNVGLTQVHALAVAGALHGHSADNLTLGGGGSTLIIADGLHAHAADGLALTQVHSLAVADGLHAHTADGLTLTQAHVLAIADTLHAHAADNVGLLAPTLLVISDGHHAHRADSLSFAVPLIITREGPAAGGVPAGAVLLLTHEGAEAGGVPAGSVLAVTRKGPSP